MRTVKDIIHSKPPATNVIEPDALVIDALAMLEKVNLSYLIVLSDDEFKGIFSERDYSRNVILKGRSSKKTKVEQVMTVNLPVVSLTDTVEQCMKSMNDNKARYLLAYDRRNFRGVVTIHDLLRQVLANREEVFDNNVAQNLIDQEESGFIY
ncbi:MAG: CBS domain-containing protein [Chitinophagaceae bacterium]|nr:CBS domain-containing protein [Chitinophagaceae bacterium]